MRVLQTITLIASKQYVLLSKVCVWRPQLLFATRRFRLLSNTSLCVQSLRILSRLFSKMRRKLQASSYSIGMGVLTIDSTVLKYRFYPPSLDLTTADHLPVTLFFYTIRCLLVYRLFAFNVIEIQKKNTEIFKVKKRVRCL